MTQAVNCPSCSRRIEINDSPQTQENIQLRQQIEQLQKIPKMQSFIPNFQCKDGTCGQVHENPLYTTRPKGKCRDCDQFSPLKEGTCSWCLEKDSIEEVDKDEIVDRGIRMPGQY